MFDRLLNLPARKSCFVFGPRQTGKSTLVKSLLRETDLYIDLLPQHNFLRYAKTPQVLAEEIRSRTRGGGRLTCIIDEVQKVPQLLDEVHALIESTNTRFILTGSSARKLKRGGANMLAGRAYTYHLFPLVFRELGEAFNLERALRVGLLPILWHSKDERPAEFLRTYAETYLKEEIAAEGLVRQIGPFARFFDIAASSDGEIVNFSNIARECGVSIPTVKQYYQILEDTFVGMRLPAWHRSIRRRLVTHPRYYLFDIGVTNILAHTLQSVRNPTIRGRRFEQFVITQLAALLHYGHHDVQLAYWRTNHGAEVDLLLCRGDRLLAAVEIKSGAKVLARDVSGLRSFQEEYPKVPCYLVGIEQQRRLREDGIGVLGWRNFVDEELEGLVR